MSAITTRGVNRRRFLNLLGGSAAIPYLMSAGSPRAAGLSGKITMIKGPHSADEAKYEAEIIDDFKKANPNAEVEFTTYDWANMNAQLTAGFASGSPADVQYLVDLVYPAYAERGVLQDMTAWVSDPSWKSEHDAIQPFAWQLAKSSKGTWGVPVLGAVYNIFVNLDLLNAAGVADTWNKSYSDMMAAAKATTKGDTFGFSMRTRVSDYAFWDWFPYIHNAGADILNKDWTANGLAGSEDAMQFLIDMHKAKVTPPVGSVDWQGQFDLFKAGKIAIYHGETPEINDLLAKPPPFKWDVAYAPPGPKAQTVMGNFGILSVAAASKNKDLAWAFIKHWASGAGSGPVCQRGQSPGRANGHRQPALRRQAGHAEDPEGVRAAGEGRAAASEDPDDAAADLAGGGERLSRQSERQGSDRADGRHHQQACVMAGSLE